MNIKTVTRNGAPIAWVESGEPLITDTPSALDLMATVKYETGSSCMVLNKEAVTEDFFRLSTCLAGEILQKYVNYDMKLAIAGDFSGYSSKALRDFIYECNRGKDVFFVDTPEEGIERLAALNKPC